MTLRLILVAHGATSATRRGAFPRDEPLEPRASARASVVRTRLPRAARILTVPALRAQQTAEALGLAAEVDDELRDCNYGRWAGLRLDELAQSDPHGLAAWRGDLESTVHGGESLAAVSRRVARWLDRQAVERSGTLIAITHAPLVRAAVLHVIGAPLGAFWKIDIAPLSCTAVGNDGARWTLSAIVPAEKKRLTESAER